MPPPRGGGALWGGVPSRTRKTCYIGINEKALFGPKRRRIGRNSGPFWPEGQKSFSFKPT